VGSILSRSAENDYAAIHYRLLRGGDTATAWPAGLAVVRGGHGRLSEGVALFDARTGSCSGTGAYAELYGLSNSACALA
jgi:hypothetical protein